MRFCDMDVDGSFLRRPYQVVYRSAKYSRRSMSWNFSRLGYLGRLVTGHLLRPILSTGVLAIVTTLALTPLLLITGLFLFLFRATRYFLVKIIYPEVQIYEKFSSRPSFPQDSILWFRGPVQFDNLIEKLIQIPQLRKRARKSFGLLVLENQFEDFQLENHILEAPQFFQNLHSPPGQKPLIQQVVSQLCSLKMSHDDPTWTLTLIRVPTGSIVLLRTHPYIQVQKFLLGLNHSSHSYNLISDYFDNLKQKGLSFYKFWQNCSKFELAREIWYTLGKIAKVFKGFIKFLGLSIRAFQFFSVQIHQIIFSSLPSNGFKKTSRPNSRLISWSEPISSELVMAILEKIDPSTTPTTLKNSGKFEIEIEVASVQSLFLTVCSLALADYYRETSLVNPGEVGISLPHNLKISIPTKSSKSFISRQLKDLTKKILNYPSWKILGHRMVELCLVHFIPGFLSSHLRGRLGDLWPISLSYLDIMDKNTNSWKSFQIQEMTTFAQSDSYVRVTVVRNFGFFRVSVSSNAQALDVALTRSLSAHLDQLAESVGLERSRRSPQMLPRHLLI